MSFSTPSYLSDRRWGDRTRYRRGGKQTYGRPSFFLKIFFKFNSRKKRQIINIPWRPGLRFSKSTARYLSGRSTSPSCGIKSHLLLCFRLLPHLKERENWLETIIQLNDDDKICFRGKFAFEKNGPPCATTTNPGFKPNEEDRERTYRKSRCTRRGFFVESSEPLSFLCV